MKARDEEDFKAVEFQRKRREELSALYNSEPREFWKQLDAIKKKYRSKFRQHEKHSA